VLQGAQATEARAPHSSEWNKVLKQRSGPWGPLSYSCPFCPVRDRRFRTFGPKRRLGADYSACRPPLPIK